MSTMTSTKKHVIGQPKDGPICDFCSATDPPRLFVTNAFLYERFETSDGTIEASCDECWATCETCAALIDKGDRAALLERVVFALALKTGIPSTTVRESSAKMLALFWKNLRRTQ